nr:MAG TPA: antibody light chain protein [Inoviridae sp.]
MTVRTLPLYEVGASGCPAFRLIIRQPVDGTLSRVQGLPSLDSVPP